MNVKEIIDDYLKANGYTGLVNIEIPCGCVAGDLAVCDGECMNLEECDAGYVHYCDDCPEEMKEDCDVDGCPCAGGYCVSLDKEVKPREPDPPSKPWITDVKLQDRVKFLNVYTGVEETGIVKVIRNDHHELKVLVDGREKLHTVGSIDFMELITIPDESDA